MKILRLGVSHDVREQVPLEDRQHVIAERMLEEETGLEWDTVLQQIWPTEKLPALVEKWVDREQPDMVVLFLAGYWVSWGSTALRMERRWKVIGPPVADVARKVAENESFNRHRSLDKIRGVVSGMVGVDYNFEPRELVARFESIIRTLLRNERLILAVRGPGRTPQRMTRWQTRASIKRAQVFAAGIQEVCERLHVEFLPYEHLPKDQQFDDRVAGDPAHYTTEGSRRHGRREGELMIRAWRRAEGQSLGPA